MSYKLYIESLIVANLRQLSIYSIPNARRAYGISAFRTTYAE